MSARRASIKVPDDTHRTIKLIAAALETSCSEIVARAVAHYRLRHTEAIERLTSQRNPNYLSDLTPRERLDLLRDEVKAKVPIGTTIWVVDDRGTPTLAFDPQPEDLFDLLFELEDLLETQVILMGIEQAREIYDLTHPRCRRL